MCYFDGKLFNLLGINRTQTALFWKFVYMVLFQRCNGWMSQLNSLEDIMDHHLPHLLTCFTFQAYFLAFLAWLCVHVKAIIK